MLGTGTQLDLMVLPPCHVFCQFYVSKLLNEFIFTLVCWQCVSVGGPWLLLDGVHADVSVGEMKQEYKDDSSEMQHCILFTINI
jgi:hypothetical protein